MSTRIGPSPPAAGTRPVRVSDPQSTTTATSWEEPSASNTIVSAAGRKTRFPGTGSEFSTVAVLPIFRGARASANSDPMASPSGFSWQAIRNRSFSRKMRQISVRSFLTAGFLRRLPQQTVDPFAFLVGGVEVEVDIGGVPHLPDPAELSPDVPPGTSEGVPGRDALLVPPEKGVVDPGDLQVEGHGDVGDGSPPQAGVLHPVLEDQGDLLPDPLRHARGTISASLHSSSSPIRRISIRRPVISISPSRPTMSVIRSRIDWARRESVETRATPILPRCLRSWNPTSATETGNPARIRPVRPLNRFRLSLRESDPGNRRSATSTATSIPPPLRSTATVYESVSPTFSITNASIWSPLLMSLKFSSPSPHSYPSTTSQMTE